MWTRPINYGVPPLMTSIIRSATIRYISNLGDRLKTLNDSKQFQQALQLFHQHQKNKNEILSSLTITQALKACTHLKDIRSGKAIHDLVSSRTKNDQYIVTSLIHMYSEFHQSIYYRMFSLHIVQCGDIRSAETLFDDTKIKDPSMYGAMMKGEFSHLYESIK